MAIDIILPKRIINRIMGKRKYISILLILLILLLCTKQLVLPNPSPLNSSTKTGAQIHDFNIDSFSSLAIKKALDRPRMFINNTIIPTLIHQTWRAESITQLHPDLTKYVETFQDKNPYYTYVYWNDDDIDEFIQRFFPTSYQQFKTIPVAVIKADLFRYMVVYIFGGIYADIDCICLKPADTWVEGYEGHEIQELIGVEFYVNDGGVQFLQWAFASAPNTIFLKLVIDGIWARLDSLHETPIEFWNKEVVAISGPVIWSQQFLFYLGTKGIYWDVQAFNGFQVPKLFTNKTMVLPVTSFAAGRDHNGYEILEEELQYSFIQHRFLGSWKGD
ncbi:nucleotide-diphospho-sugar transferase [Globomyces pollinis-pini]|nr:nucleotide-diphospho-sugar transferase [Globomyces pollinis-pini]